MEARRRPWRTGLALSAACITLAPAVAQAAPSSIRVGPDAAGFTALIVAATPTDTTNHRITVSFAGGAYTVADRAGVAPGPGCVAIPPNPAALTDTPSVSCQENGAQFIDISGGAGPDRMKVPSFGPVVQGGGFVTFNGLGGRDIIEATPLGDTATGGSGPDVLLGGARPDEFSGGPGNDLLEGGGGADDLSGRRGNDRVFGDAGADRLFGGAGNDLLVGGPGNDFLRPGPGRNHVHP
jgi:Ca2+-binding RTX toxin-like protein